MDEEENVTLSMCTASIVIRKKGLSYSCPCSLCSLIYKDNDGFRTIAPIAHIPQFSTCVRPFLHVACYRNKYREGGDCLDIEDRGWVV